MPLKKRPKLEKTVFDESENEERMRRRSEHDIDNKPMSEEMRRCFDILVYMMANPNAEPFLEPVDWQALGLPTYPTIVKNPMDLGTIKHRLLNGQIPNPSKFADLMRLVWKNSMKFNEAGSVIHILSQSLLDEFEGNFDLVKIETPKAFSQFSQMQVDYPVAPAVVSNDYSELEATIASLEEKIKQTQNEINELKATQQAQAEEKAALSLPVNRITTIRCIQPRKPLTYQEKEDLCRRITELDETSIPGLLEVISVSNSGSEVEVDIENLDDATLLRVQAYLEQVSLRKSKHTNRTSSGGYDSDGDYIDPARKPKNRKR